GDGRGPPVPRPAATVPARGAAGPVACFSASGNHFATGYPRPVRQPQPAATVDQGRSVSAGQPDGRAPRRDDRQRVRDHLGLSIVATILCAPVGALGLLHALRAADHLARGDVPGARRVARRGRAWSLAATAAGMLLLAALAATGGGHRG
ncbi:CD225/dispanin family protein, partial [Frankia canadensis]|uniref:CD225/dispanin family protein n=1 Tax=Frankia canadensis TaxID=1836972 RepID=UPI001A9C9847